MTAQSELGLLRLAAQRLAGPPAAGPAEAVRWLTAVQAQNLPGALVSVALRSRDGRLDDVTAALDAGEVVRSWPMRGTLHLVAAEDLCWLLELLGPRMLAAAATRRARLGLTDAVGDRARELAVTALTGGRRLRRVDLLAVLADGGLDVTEQRGPHLLGVLAQTGVLCLGPTGGGDQQFVLVDEWVRAPRRLSRDEALTELALRYFRSHGPAPVEDLVRWAGLTVRDVRAGLEGARPALATLDLDGVQHLMDPETPERLAACREEARGPFLLPGFDEFVLGYGDRRAVLDPAFAERIVPGGNGMFRATVVLDGRIVGTWQQTGRGARPSVTATPFTAFPDGVEAAIRRRAEALP